MKIPANLISLSPSLYNIYIYFLENINKYFLHMEIYVMVTDVNIYPIADTSVV